MFRLRISKEHNTISNRLLMIFPIHLRALSLWHSLMVQAIDIIDSRLLLHIEESWKISSRAIYISCSLCVACFFFVCAAFASPLVDLFSPHSSINVLQSVSLSKRMAPDNRLLFNVPHQQHFAVCFHFTIIYKMRSQQRQKYYERTREHQTHSENSERIQTLMNRFVH